MLPLHIILFNNQEASIALWLHVSYFHSLIFLFSITLVERRREITSSFQTKRAYTLTHTVPPLSSSLKFTKSSPYHKSNSCSEDIQLGVDRTDKISSGETELYPGILYHSKERIVRNCFGGRRIRLAVIVMVTLTRACILATQPQ